MMEDKSLDITAKLLANENLNVIRANVSTASFDIKNRTLVLPQWKNMSPDVDQMLVAHEVSHALFTPIDYVDALTSNLKFKNARSYLNILEDARVEKLMKSRYAGIRKTFNNGYKQLNDMDFFGVANRDLSTSHLLDRINLYFKVGFNCGVTFTNEEKVFVTRAEKTETVQDVIQLAQDIHNFLMSKQQDQLKIETPNSEDVIMDFNEDDDEEDEQDEELDENGYSDEDGETGSEETDDQGVGEPESDDTGNSQGTRKSNAPSTGNDPQDDERTSPVTDANYEHRVKELADTNTEYKYWSIEPVSGDRIIDYKTVLKTTNKQPVNNVIVKRVKTFLKDTQNNVDYMVKEFELRKAATSYKRTTTSKSGSLDMKKIWSYKLNDDLFKRITATKKGKNHGMLFLLDWSGSMKPCIDDTIDQVINLVMFCERINIPYQVFAFSDGTITSGNFDDYYESMDLNTKDCKIDVSCRYFSMIELFSHRMSKSELNKMILRLKDNAVMTYYPLQGTPLNEALVFMYEYMGKFQKDNNVEKLSFITLTDGDGCSLPVRAACSTFDETTQKYISNRHFFKDVYSKKNIEFTNASNQTRGLLEMIKNRYGCAIVGFFIGRAKDLNSCMRIHYDIASGLYDTRIMIDRAKSEMRSNGFASLSGTGRDELYVIPSSSKIDTSTLNVNANSTARSLAKQFGKFMTMKKTSRVLLNRFIKHIA